jgi:hypothetical protein
MRGCCGSSPATGSTRPRRLRIRQGAMTGERPNLGENLKVTVPIG